MIDIICKLPENIKLHILSYSYSPQPKLLLADIKSYFYTYAVIYNYYYEIYNWTMIEDKESNLTWLLYDLLLYSNHNFPIRNGYVDYFYTMMYRHYMLQNKSKNIIDKVISKMHNKGVNTRINILWGLYTPDERIQFLCNIYNK